MNEQKRRASFKETCWPTISDTGSAIKAGKQGAAAAFFCAALTGVLATLAVLGVKVTTGAGPSGLFDALLFAGLGIGILKMSRACAVAVIVLYCIENIVRMPVNQAGVWVLDLCLLYFANGVRGTFEFHRYQGSTTRPQAAAPLEQFD